MKKTKQTSFIRNHLITGIHLAAAGLIAAGILFSTDASAESVKTSGDYKYTKKGREVTITKYTGKKSVLKVPSKIKGFKVKAIGRGAFKNNKKLKKITLPEGIKIIYRNSFMNCSNLKEVKLPDTLNKLYGYSFKDCARLKKVHFGSGTSVVGESCFAGCTSLESIVLPDKVTSVRSQCFAGCTGLKNINFENITEISHSSFENCVSLEGNIALDNVRELWIDSFIGCKGITGVRFSEALEVVGSDSSTPMEYDLRDVQGMRSSNPFGGCTSLQNIEIAAANSNFTSIDGVLYGKNGEWLVAYPAGRTGEYTVPDKVKGIGDSAFKGSKLSKINLPDSIKCVFPEAFKGSAITDIKLPGDPNSNVYYGRKTFDGCKNIVNFSFPEGMKSSKGITFAGCTSLKTVIIPSTMTELGGMLYNGMFSGCTSLETVTLPTGLCDIPDSCFEGCVSLKNINLENIASIGIEAFKGCTGLAGKLNLVSTGTIYAKAFEGCTGITEVALPASASAIGIFPKNNPIALTDYEQSANMNDGNNPFGKCTSLEKISLEDGCSNYTVIDGCLYSKDMEHLISVPCAKTGKFIIPYGTCYINPYAFYGSKAESVVLPSSLTDIDYNAFKDCLMKQLTLGKNVMTIQNVHMNYNKRLTQGVFPGCINLEEVIVNEKNTTFKSIDGVLYYLPGDGSKSLVYYPSAKKGKSFTTSKKTLIGGGAFSNCRHLKKIVISPKTSAKTLDVIMNNCKGIKLYIPNTIKKYADRPCADNSGNITKYNILGVNCSKCKIYVKKNSTLVKKLKKSSVSKNVVAY